MTILLFSEGLDQEFYQEAERPRAGQPDAVLLYAGSAREAERLLAAQPDLLAGPPEALELFLRYRQARGGLRYIALVPSPEVGEAEKLRAVRGVGVLDGPVTFAGLMDCAGRLAGTVEEDAAHQTFAGLGERWRMILEHQFFINLLMTRTSKNSQAVLEHGRMLGLQVDTDACCRPALLRIVGDKPFSRWDDPAGLPGIKGLLADCLRASGPALPVHATYYDDSHAIFLLPGLPAGEARALILRWLARCREALGVCANCCVGKPRRFLLLCEEMPALLRASDLQPEAEPVAWADEQDEDENEAVIRSIKQYIETHLDHELSRKELANHVFLSESYVSHIWHDATGCSLKDYVTAVRMERARKMLRETALPVSRIAALLGYTHFSNFSNMFRKKNRLSPAEYRKQFMEGRQDG